MVDYNSLHTGGQIDDAVDKVLNLEQSTGNSASSIMSQDAVTAGLNAKADSANLATVATSGSYSDLSDKPTIPATPITIANGGTGATTSADARTNLHVPSTGFYFTTSDFNNMKNFGIFGVNSAINAPISTSNMYILIAGNIQKNYIAQIAISMGTNRIFVRTNNSTNWSVWKEITTQAV